MFLTSRLKHIGCAISTHRSETGAESVEGEMKTSQFLERRAFFPSIVAMLLGMGLFVLMAPDGVRADSLATFNFSGTLANPVNGDASVTGQFTLDLTNATITSFDFVTPVENISSTSNSPTWTPTLFAHRNYSQCPIRGPRFYPRQWTQSARCI